jgi:hypothetical protein
MIATDWTSWLGLTAAAGAMLLALPGIRRAPRAAKLVLLAAVAGLGLLPLHGLPLFGYVRALTGDLSVATVVLAITAILGGVGAAPRVDSADRNTLLAIVVVLAVVLYPMALGIGRLDPYRLGYGDPLFVAAVVLLALGAWWRRLDLVGVTLALAVLGWTVGWSESTNLWDYLIDVAVVLYALIALVIAGLGRILRTDPRRDRAA